MPGHLFISLGDLSQLAADAVAYSASSALSANGNLYSSFAANVPTFAERYAELRRKGPPLQVGDARWVALSADRKPYGVVVVASTGGGYDTDKPGLAVRNAVATAVENLRAAGRTERLLIALPAFRTGLGGDAKTPFRSAISQVAAAAAALDQHADIDIAFLTYTPSLYRIFVEARRSVLPEPKEPFPCPTLANALRDRACVMFVGAGLSSGAGLPGWDDLISRLSGELGIKPDSRIDHLDLAQWYRERFGNDRLSEVLRATFGARGLPTLAHYLLASLPLRYLITTNYDHLLEQALIALKRHPVSVVKQSEVARTGGEAVYVVKLHGDADHPADIILSREDYQSFFERRPAMALLLEGLLLNQTFCFVGYSLRDPNFRQIFGRVRRMMSEADIRAFATSFETRSDTLPYLVRQWHAQQLELVPVTGDTFAQQQVNFLYFLDRLAEEVTMRSPPPALTADVPVSKPLHGLRSALEDAGELIESLCEADLDQRDALLVADVLTFLTRHGWRPRGWQQNSLVRMWEYLALQTTDPEERRRRLIAALGSAETFADARRLRDELEKA